MSIRCCCGRFKTEEAQGVETIPDLPAIINTTIHEELGLDESFCGPIESHELRDARVKLTKAETIIQNARVGFRLVAVENPKYEAWVKKEVAKMDDFLGTTLV